jgi:tRNA-2-methylthio-N6-dimethylallyladenosine synthase
LLAEQQAEFTKSCEGLSMQVLFEKRGRKSGQAVGRSPYLQPVHVDDAEDLIGNIHDVTIVQALPNSLKGTLSRFVRPEPAAAH